jgi:hypothetical protein
MNRQVRTYPGATGKSIIAEDEWLELNNKEFLNIPSVQALDGMSRQENYIVMAQQCKRFLETVYSAGAITERMVYQSGTGAKGNGLLERNLLCEVVHLFLGDCVPLVKNHVENQRYLSRHLKHGVISVLEKELKTKLDRS